MSSTKRTVQQAGFTPAFSVKSVAIFLHPPFHSQSKPMHTGVGYMHMSPQVQKVMLVSCDGGLLLFLPFQTVLSFHSH